MKYCTHCGSENQLSAQFCSSCGQAFQNEVESFTIRPVFKSGLFFLRYLIWIIFLGYFPLWVLGSMFVEFLELFDLSELTFNLLLLVFGLVFYGVLTGVLHWMTKRNYEKTTYSFLPDRLVYYDGFFNREKKEVRYEMLREIGYTEGIFQRMYGLGSINLSTSATAASNKQRAGIVSKNGQIPSNGCLSML